MPLDMVDDLDVIIDEAKIKFPHAISYPCGYCLARFPTKEARDKHWETECVYYRATEEFARELRDKVRRAGQERKR